MTFDEVLTRFEGARRNGSGFKAKCPAHPDRDPSLSVNKGRDGTLITCHAGCATKDVLAAVGLSVTDLFYKTGGSRTEDAWGSDMELDTTYDYVDEQGHLLFQALRYRTVGGKTFRQRRPGGPGEPEWVSALNGVRRVIYRLPEILAETNHVYVVEGEKDADTLAARGLVATCNPMGAGKWLDEYTESLGHVRKVTVLADRDKAGYDHAGQVAESLAKAGINHDVLQTPDGFKDVTDLFDGGLDLDALVPVDGAGERYRPVDLHLLLTTERPEREWLFEPLLVAGKHVGLVASRGDGKSLLALEIACAVATGRAGSDGAERRPRHVVYLDMEMGEDDLYDRLLDLGWEPDHPQFPTLAEHLHYYQLINLPPLDTEEGGLELEYLVRKDGADVVIVDTLSRVTTGKENETETYTALWRHSEMRLKRRLLTYLRLDHLGKSSEAGSRGASAKEDPLDIIWQMTASGDTLTLKLTKGRIAGLPPKVKMTRRWDNGILIHEVEPEFVSEAVVGLVAEIDGMYVPDDASVRAVAKALRANGMGRKNDLVRQAVAIRHRRIRPSDPGAGHLSDQEQPHEEGSAPVQRIDANGKCTTCGMGEGRHAAYCKAEDAA